MAKLDKAVARIRGMTYANPNDLAREVSAALSSIARQPSFVRGLEKGVVADVQGGTTLGVGDPSATYLSSYLVQNPQTGLPSKVGTLQTRRQSRVEMLTRECPGIVTVGASAGDRTLHVRVTATGPYKTTDQTTGVEVAGDPLANLAASGTNADNVTGKDYVATVTGQDFVTPGHEGWQPPTVGQTVPVTISQQWEVTTTWTLRTRTWVPVVTRKLVSDTATVKNGMAFILT